MDIVNLVNVGDFIDELTEVTEQSWNDIETAMFDLGLWPEGFHAQIYIDTCPHECPWMNEAINKVLKKQNLNKLSLTELD